MDAIIAPALDPAAPSEPLALFWRPSARTVTRQLGLGEWLALAPYKEAIGGLPMEGDVYLIAREQMPPDWRGLIEPPEYAQSHPWGYLPAAAFEELVPLAERLVWANFFLSAEEQGYQVGGGRGDLPRPLRDDPPGRAAGGLPDRFVRVFR